MREALYVALRARAAAGVDDVRVGDDHPLAVALLLALFMAAAILA